MKVLIAYSSVHHKNTEKVAKAMAKACNADLVDVVELEEKKLDNIEKYDLIGFGSGIYGGKPHKSMEELLENLPVAEGTMAFVFSTSTFQKNKYNEAMAEKLIEKGYQVYEGFSCKGWNSFGPFKIVGGKDKGRPSQEDLYDAQQYVKRFVDAYEYEQSKATPKEMESSFDKIAKKIKQSAKEAELVGEQNEL